ncbi:MAG: hydrogenase iron-sulfur subunit [Desulfobaccales bacterium]
MNLSDPAKPVNVLVIHGPELAAAGLDSREFSQAVAALPHCRVLTVDPGLEAAALEEQVQAFLQEDREVRPVILAAKNPEHRGAAVARWLTDEMGLDAASLGQVDLTAAWGQPDPGTRTAKALEMIRLAAAQFTGAGTFIPKSIAVNRRVLVWGDSYAALKAAWELAQLDYPVILAGPHPDFEPLSLEDADGGAWSASLADLIRQIREHQLIKTVQVLRLRDVDGATGNFTVRLETPQGVITEQVGAILLAPELQRQEALTGDSTPEHPGIVTQSRLEALLAGDSGQKLPGTVAILTDLAGESHPLSLSRALKAASRLLDAGSRVYLLVGDAKLAAPGLQRELRGNQEAGLILIKVKECPAVSAGDEGLSLSFFEPTLREKVKLRVDMAVFADQYRAPAGNADLAGLLRLPLGAGGFLQEDNVHHLPVATSRRGLYVIGPGRGIMDLEETQEDVSAAVMEIQGLLGQGQVAAPLGRAVVDRGKCVLCLTCHRFCPHGAITWDSRAIVNELACQGCGICASQCPNDAIQVQNFTDGQMTGMMEAFDPQLSPRIVAFMCRNSGWEAYQTAVKFQAASLPPGFTPVKLPCAGKVDPDYLLQAFNAGADGVLVLGCPRDNCKSTHGNVCAEWAVEQAQELLAEAGIEPQRLLFHSLAANAPGDFINAVDHLLANLSQQAAVTDADHPFWLTSGTTFTGRIPGGKTGRVLQESPEFYLELNAQDGRNLGLKPGDQIRTSSSLGTVTATVAWSDRVRPGTVLLPRHCRKEALQLLIDAGLEPIARMPGYQGCAVSLAKLVENFEEVFGLQVPTSRYLHRGHTWLALESGGVLRLGMDDFSQKLLGPGDGIVLPVPGEEIRRDMSRLTLFRQGEKAPVLAPVYGVIDAVNTKVLNRPGLIHDDPYGDGWLMIIAPTNLQPDLEHLVSGEASAPWIEEESMRLLSMLEPSVGATLQSGGAMVDDIYGQYPELGWERLVKEFLRSA